MLTIEQMKGLRRTNISKDAEKTKERVKEYFGSAKAAKKRELSDAIGQGLNSVYRIYHEGTVTARMVMGLASVFDVSPYYFTGESDEKVPCSNELLKQLLEENGYSELASEFSEEPVKKQKRVYNRRKPKEEAAVPVEVLVEVPAEVPAEVPVEAAPEPVAIPEAAVACSPCETVSQPISYELDEEEAAFLLKALFIRAKGGGKAAENLRAVKKHLLS